MARTGKYSHGKSKGTSDRKSSGRLATLGGTTGPIKEYDLKSGAGATPKFKTVANDYYQSQPLNFPSAPDIPDAPRRPDDSQNLRNVATALGAVNTNLQRFTTDFWQFQKSMDTAARAEAERRAEEGESANTSLNKAKLALEKKAENDPEASASYGIFSSMDQRVEREYVVVTAKKAAMDVITSFEDNMSEIYQGSFSDESRRNEDTGKIIPLNPSSPEFTQLATSYFAEKIPNVRARMELQDKIQAAIYSSRRNLSTEHRKYKDNTAIEGKNNAIGTTILNASTASQETLTGTGITSTEWTTDQDVDAPGTVTKLDLGMSFTNDYTNFNQKSGVSMKSYNAQTQSGVILTDVANQVIAVSNNPLEVRKNSDVALTLLMNTKIGTAKLVDMVGGKKKLERMWNLAISAKRNEASRILDRDAINNAGQLAELDFGTINDQDANLDTPEVDPILNGDGMRTVTVKNPDGSTTDYLIPSQGGVNITGVIGKINRLQFDARNKFSTVQEAAAYIKRLEELKNGFLDSRTSDQRNENYEWLLKTTSGSPDQAVRNKQLINYFYRTNRIDQAQYQLLSEGINPNYTQEKANYNILVNGSGGNDGLFATADGYITNHYRLKTNKTIKALSQWDKEDRDAYENDKAAFRTKANIIFNKNIPYSQRVAELNQLLSDTKEEYQNRNKELKESKTGKSEENIQVGTNKSTIQNNDEGGNQSFTYQTPKELVAELEGGLNARGNPQQNSSLVTAARENTLYSTPILVQQLNQFEDLALVLKNKNMDGNSLNVWGWIQGAEATAAVRGPRALSYTREMPAILGRINKDMSAKEFYLSQMKLHGLPITKRHHEILDLIFPDERNSQFQFEDVKKNNEVSSSILNKGTLVASTDLTGVLKKEPTPPPRIDPSEDKKLYPEGIETGNYVLPKNVTDDKEFVSAVEKLSTELKIPVNYLWAVMGFETGGTYDPAQKNKAGSGAVGLIQFMPDTLKEWGVTTEEAAKMTRVEQLELVAKHLKRWTRPGDDFRDVYMSILFPVAAGKPNDYVLFTKGTKEKPNTRYDQNIGLDKNGDGTITKEEAASSILQYLPALPVKEVPKTQDSSTIGGRSNIA